MPVRPVLLALLLAVPSALGAQAADSATFVVTVGGDTLAVERFRRTPTRVTGDLLLRRPIAKLARYDLATSRDGAAERLRVEEWSGLIDTTSAGARVEIAFGRDSVTVTMPGSGDDTPQRVRAARGTAAYINPSAALLEPLLRRAREAARGGEAEVPLFILPGASVTARVRWHGRDSATVTLGATAMEVRLDRDGRLLRGWVPSQGVRMARAGDRPAVAAAPERLDYSAPPGAPYTAREVTVPTPPGHVLAGTLTLPKDADGPVPVVVTITGSGAQERDQRLRGIEGYRPFAELADTLGRRGIGVLRLDDRGTGASGGTARDATSADFADDVRAALAWLRERDDVDGRRLALVGHSEGGMIAPMVAATDTLLRGIVLMAAPSRTGRRISRAQQRWLLERDTTRSPAERARLAEQAAAQADSVAQADRWTAFFFEHDPLVVARRVRTPVLVLQGETDVQITPEQADELAEAIRAGGNRDVTVRRFEDTNHLFVADPSGDPLAYARLEDTSVRDEVLGTIADWLVRRLRVGR